MTNQRAAPDHTSDLYTSSTASYNYPFAAAPDIIRSHQKDAYFQGTLLNHLSSITRNLYGARFLHTYASEAHTFADLLYLGLTTFIGNRTLGEEYCDIIQIEEDTLKLPSIYRRAGYILTTILLPYSLNWILPSFRAKLRVNLEANLRCLSRQKQQKSKAFKIQSYLLTHLSTFTSPSPVHALTLMAFYFTGSYYKLSKRIWGLRYIFTKRIGPSHARAGYEVLGALLLLQISVQGWMYLHSALRSNNAQAQSLDIGMSGQGVKLLFASPNLLQDSKMNIEKSTHTPTSTGPRYSLKNDNVMGWIKGRQQRKCTLCLEELKDPSATQCGHVFCWACIGDWVREKPECPLCRRATLVQHVLPLRS